MNTVSLKVFCLVLFAGLVIIPSTVPAGPGDREAGALHEKQISEWRQARHERLSSDNGWLTLVGLEWLQEGENRVGSSPSSSARIPGGPLEWGSIYLADDKLRFVLATGSGVMVDGAAAPEAPLVADNRGEPTVVSYGDLSFYVIYRESYALRIKDRKAATLREFTGVKSYDFGRDWRFEGRFIPANEGQSIDIANVLGQLSPTPVHGYVEFERNGETYRLLGLGEENSESVWFLFADRTSGRETYGAGRFLYSDGMPKDGKLVIDFNKAYNPPCAFTDYSTCPLPPQQNRLDLAVTAGEKDYHSH